VLLGEEELGRNVATLRDLDSGAQREVPLGSLAAALRGSAALPALDSELAEER
jgi:hypothetical protein